MTAHSDRKPRKISRLFQYVGDGWKSTGLDEPFEARNNNQGTQGVMKRNEKEESDQTKPQALSKSCSAGCDSYSHCSGICSGITKVAARPCLTTSKLHPEAEREKRERSCKGGKKRSMHHSLKGSSLIKTERLNQDWHKETFIVQHAFLENHLN